MHFRVGVMWFLKKKTSAGEIDQCFQTRYKPRPKKKNRGRRKRPHLGGDGKERTEETIEGGGGTDPQMQTRWWGVLFHLEKNVPLGGRGGEGGSNAIKPWELRRCNK